MRQPENMNALRARAALLTETKNFAKAADDLDRLIKLDGKNAQLYYQRGSLREKDSKHDLAVADYKLALARDRNMNEARQALARVEADIARERKQREAGLAKEKKSKGARDDKKTGTELPTQAAKTETKAPPKPEPVVSKAPEPVEEKPAGTVAAVNADGPPAGAIADALPTPAPPVRGRAETKPRERNERSASSHKEPERKTASSASKQRELEDKKREKEARARKERMWERQQAERLAQRRTGTSQPQIRYYRAGSNEPSRGMRFTDAFR
jgi:tetratricopeptide (TPR) repeat protein